MGNNGKISVMKALHQMRPNIHESVYTRMDLVILQLWETLLLIAVRPKKFSFSMHFVSASPIVSLHISQDTETKQNQPVKRGKPDVHQVYLFLIGCFSFVSMAPLARDV